MSSNKLSRSLSTGDLNSYKKKYLYNFFLKKDLKKIKDHGLNCFIIPKDYYLWKGIHDSYKTWVDNHDITNLKSHYFADKSVASKYGTKKNGYDLQFKIINDIKLVDISDDNNIQKIYSTLKSLTEQQLLQYTFIKDNYNEEKQKWLKKEKLQEKYPIFLDYFIKQNLLDIIIDTIAEYVYDPLLKTYKSPKKAKRKSYEDFDVELEKIICNIFNNVDGWIYFFKDEDDFHDEIYICNAPKFIKYIDFHKI